MNLNAYDNVTEKLDKTKTWVDIKSKTIFSKEIKYRPYISLLKRYDVRINSSFYYLALLDEPPIDRKYKTTFVDEYGRIKFNISSIWKETYLTRLGSNCNICIDLVESEVDGDVYLLDV